MTAASPATLLRAAADGLLAVLVAPRCAACGQLLSTPTHGPVCEDCWQAVRRFAPPLCICCGCPLPSWRLTTLEQQACPRCRRGVTVVTCRQAIGAYEGSLRHIIHALKYDGRRSVATRLGNLMRESGSAVLRTADLVVPVPLHWRRHRQRGFNQAHELARHLGVPVCSALVRVRATPPQVDLPAARRHANVRGAFALAGRRWPPGRRARLVRLLRGRTVVIVDDVCTTGATIGACARVLLSAGVAQVRALTAAQAVATGTTGSARQLPIATAHHRS